MSIVRLLHDATARLVTAPVESLNMVAKGNKKIKKDFLVGVVGDWLVGFGYSQWDIMLLQ